MLSLILPTYNEAKNLPELIASLEKVLTMPHEIIVVDDNSPDKTWEVAEAMKKKYVTLHVIRRIGRRGLSSAVVEGFARAKGSVLMVMDSDLQHDPKIVVSLYQLIVDGADIAVASRYREGGSVGEWVTGRRILSKAGTMLATWLPPVHSTDPMSGFFAVKHTSYKKIASGLHPTGFKILLEVLANLPASSRIAEVPLKFAPRKHGESKLNIKVESQFVIQIVRIAAKRMALPFFFIATIIMLALLIPRVWALRLLYIDPVVRQEVIRTLQNTSHAKGWLLSDMLMQSVTSNSVTILHHEHLRGSDSIECFELALHSSDISPCAK